jgi:hypothetical protein
MQSLATKNANTIIPLKEDSFMKKFLALSITLILILSLTLGACKDKNATEKSTATTGGAVTSTINATTATPTTTAATTTVPSTSPSTTPTTTSTQATTAPAFVAYNPLNGLALTDPSRADMRPVAVMINNIKVATPQLGINAADLYYEMVVEGGITRMMVLFADPKTVPELGSIRSARIDYVDLAGGHDALLTHAGGAEIAIDLMARLKIEHIDMMSIAEAFWRDPVWHDTRGSEHSVKTTGARLTAAIATHGFRSKMKNPAITAFGFLPVGENKPAADPVVSPAKIVTVEFSNYNTSSFQYDTQTKLYSKYEFGRPQIDLADNKALQVTNVVVIRTSIKNIANSPSVDANLTSGAGFYISNGARIPIRWRKGTTLEPLVLLKEDGSPLLINRGKTYICIQDTSRSLKFS